MTERCRSRSPPLVQWPRRAVTPMPNVVGPSDVRGSGEGRGEEGKVGGSGTERGGGGGVIIVSCMAVVRRTIDPRTPTMSGRSTSGFHRPGRPCAHQVRNAVGCSASRMKGKLHPAKKRCDADFGTLCVLFLRMDDSVGCLGLFSGRGHSQRQVHAGHVIRGT